MHYHEKNYSIVVLLENAGSGGVVAAPVAREVFKDIVKVNQLVSR
jgi:cell division protein FtsI/penicillin-binding protein 2